MTQVDTIMDGIVVSLAYLLTVDGEEVDRATAESPLEYLHGADNIVPGLEQALEGRRVGERVSVSVPPELGYGAYDEEEIDEYDRDEIPDADQLEPGTLIEVEDENGFIYEGIITEVTDSVVLVDFNHPLAGKTLHFDVEILSLREADPEELDHGHPHALDGFYGDNDYDDDDYDDDDGRP